LAGGKAAFAGGLAQHHERLDRRADALQILRADRAQRVGAAQKPQNVFGDDKLVGLGDALQAGGQIGGLTDDRGLLRGAGADQIADDHHAGGDPDPRRQRRSVRRLGLFDGLDDREARAHRTLGIVFAGARPAEIAQHAVAHELGDEPLEPADHAGDGVLIAGDDVAHVLGINARRHLGRADKIDEHDGEVAAFSVGRGGGVSGVFDRGGWCADERRAVGVFHRLDRATDPAPRPHRQPDFLQVFFGQVCQV
jgi:hypothetical protein